MRAPVEGLRLSGELPRTVNQQFRSVPVVSASEHNGRTEAMSWLPVMPIGRFHAPASGALYPSTRAAPQVTLAKPASYARASRVRWRGRVAAGRAAPDAHGFEQDLRVERLAEAGAHAAAHDGRDRGGEGGDDDDGDGAEALAILVELLQHLPAAHHGHHQIEQHE